MINLYIHQNYTEFPLFLLYIYTY